MEKTRAKVQARFLRVLGEEELAKRLEICTWNWTVKTCERDGVPLYWENPRYRYRYTTRALGLEQNLRHPKNPGLLQRVLSREVPVKKLAVMTPMEMWPEQWEEWKGRAVHKQLEREFDVDPANAPDGAYTCSRCKSKKTVYRSLQIRSADEPLTTFVRCLACNKAWKD